MAAHSAQDLFTSGLVWQADRLARPAQAGLPTGYALLDAQLPGRGWPRGALIEVFAEHPGIGEVQILLPVLAQTPPGRWVAWIASPWQAYAPALCAAGVDPGRLLQVCPATAAQTTWATRLALSSGACHAVVAWHRSADNSALRRLQLAAEDSGTPLFLYRPIAAQAQSSPASLRLRLVARHDGVGVIIVKRKGPPASGMLHLPITPTLRACASASVRHALDCPAPAVTALAGIHPRHT